MEITRETILGDIIKIPGKEEILVKYKVPCLTCPMASSEIADLKLGDVCQTYNIDLEKILRELNK